MRFSVLPLFPLFCLYVGTISTPARGEPAAAGETSASGATGGNGLSATTAGAGVSDRSGYSGGDEGHGGSSAGAGAVPTGPPIAYEPGRRYQDQFVWGTYMEPIRLGPADCTANVNSGDTGPVILYDQIAVAGPENPPSGMEWKAELYFRIVREGPAQYLSPYQEWKDRVGITEVGPDAAFSRAVMDTSETGSTPVEAVRVGYYAEEDPRFDFAAGELTDDNEIIEDVIPTGTKIEYFVASYYVADPEVRFTTPDTTGGMYNEFEILPAWRTVDGTEKFPCVLYVDASHEENAKSTIETALSGPLPGYPDGIAYDRYDYLEADSPETAPFAKIGYSGPGVNVYQLREYRCILLDTGSLSDGMWPEDFLLFGDWFDLVECGGSRRAFYACGENAATILQHRCPSFLNNHLGAILISSSYRDLAMDDNEYVKLEPTDSAPLDSVLYAWGNQESSFDVIAPVASGIGTRFYTRIDTGERVGYNQVVNVDEEENFRTLLSGVGWDHLSSALSSDPEDVLTAAREEIVAALQWAFSGPPPEFCYDPCWVIDVPEGGHDSGTDRGATRLYASVPNPFHPKTVLRFSLGRSGPAVVAIFDPQGRKVRTLIDQTLVAGLHDAVWDGTDDEGRTLAAGVFWAQLRTGDYRSNKKLVLLR